MKLQLFVLAAFVAACQADIGVYDAPSPYYNEVATPNLPNGFEGYGPEIPVNPCGSDLTNCGPVTPPPRPSGECPPIPADVVIFITETQTIYTTKIVPTVVFKTVVKPTTVVNKNVVTQTEMMTFMKTNCPDEQTKAPGKTITIDETKVQKSTQIVPGRIQTKTVTEGAQVKQVQKPGQTKYDVKYRTNIQTIPNNPTIVNTQTAFKTNVITKQGPGSTAFNERVVSTKVVVITKNVPQYKTVLVPTTVVKQDIKTETKVNVVNSKKVSYKTDVKFVKNTVYSTKTNNVVVPKYVTKTNYDKKVIDVVNTKFLTNTIQATKTAAPKAIVLTQTKTVPTQVVQNIDKFSTVYQDGRIVAKTNVITKTESKPGYAKTVAVTKTQPAQTVKTTLVGATTVAKTEKKIVEKTLTVTKTDVKQIPVVKTSVVNKVVNIPTKVPKVVYTTETVKVPIKKEEIVYKTNVRNQVVPTRVVQPVNEVKIVETTIFKTNSIPSGSGDFTKENIVFETKTNVLTDYVQNTQYETSTVCQPDRSYLPLPNEIVRTVTKTVCQPTAAPSFNAPQYYEAPRGFSSNYQRTPILHF